jgi:hypothetical protein
LVCLSDLLGASKENYLGASEAIDLGAWAPKLDIAKAPELALVINYETEEFFVLDEFLNQDSEIFALFGKVADVSFK